MNAPVLFKGCKVVAAVGPSVPHSPEWEQLTWAIRAWRRASLMSGQDMSICENAARELEIERDHGLIIHLNARI